MTCCLGVLLLCSLSMPRFASADPPRVRVVLVGQTENHAPIRAVLEAILVDRGVTGDWSTRSELPRAELVEPRGGGALAHIWLVDRGRDGIDLYIADATADRILVRSVAPDQPTVSPEVLRETAGHIVDSAIAALQAGTPIGRPRADVAASLGVDSPPAPTVSTPAPSEPDASVDPRSAALAAGYRLAAWELGKALLHGPYLSATLTYGQRLRWGATLALAVQLPERTEAELASTVLAGGDLRLTGNVRWGLAPALELQGALGLAGMLLHATPRTGTLNIPLRAESFWFASYRVLGGLAVAWTASPTWAIRAEVTLDYDLTDTRFVVTTPTSSVVVLDPSRWWPGVAIGIEWRSGS